MLVKDSFIIDPKTFALIQELQSLDELEKFVLVGGTSLALQIGHRNSIDIDLFSKSDFDANGLVEYLEREFKSIQILNVRKNTLSCVIKGVKTDFITHNYPYLSIIKSEEGIRFLGLEDIAAFKINAIVNSGQRLKDFVDVYFLLTYFSMNDLVRFYTAKYSARNAMMAVKALNYFNEIDPNLDPPKLKNKLSLQKIKSRIVAATQKPDKVF